MTSGLRPARRGGRSTSTSGFGVSRRESHDSSGFYDRFGPPRLSSDATVNAVGFGVDAVHCRDGCEMTEVLPANSVALVVTSPPYFVGKEYEVAGGDLAGRSGVLSDGLGVDDLVGAPRSLPERYVDYLAMLRRVFAACVEVLEPGGRIAVNVANLGRKPYRSLSGDVISILQDDLGLLLRGEIIWEKAQGANGSVAWGSYRDATNPVLRDVTERIVVASKGRFARTPKRVRARSGLPHESTLSADEFMEATLDVWRIAPESARRVGHPAPFPVELPRRLIDLYTYKDDVVVDPFLGSGTTLVAAARAERRGFGFDLDPDYCDTARRRLRAEASGGGAVGDSAVTAGPASANPPTAHQCLETSYTQAVLAGRTAADIARDLLAEAGFEVCDTAARVGRVTFDLRVRDARGKCYFIDVAGGFTTVRPGLVRREVLWKTLGRVLQAHPLRGPVERVLVLTPRLPKPRSEADRLLRAVGPRRVFDVVEIFDPAGCLRLRRYAQGEAVPAPGFWTRAEIEGLSTQSLW